MLVLLYGHKILRRKEARWKLHKDAAKHYKIAAVQPLTTHLTNQVRQTRYTEYCWRSKDEPIISDALLWISVHRHSSIDRPGKIYISIAWTPDAVKQ